VDLGWLVYLSSCCGLEYEWSKEDESVSPLELEAKSEARTFLPPSRQFVSALYSGRKESVLLTGMIE